MLNGKPILIVEDEAVIALCLAAAVREAGGEVIGPVASVERALHILQKQPIRAAILDANLKDRDVTPLALRLSEQKIPFIVHSAVGLPQELADALPDTPLVMKPADATQVVSTLISLIQKPGRDMARHSQTTGITLAP